MQPATAATVLGDFDDARFDDGAFTARFLREGDRFQVETEGPDGRVERFEVAWVFGVEPLQQVLLALPGGRLQAFTVAWDTRAERWFSLYPGERFAPEDPLHWSGAFQRWNVMCADCHSTALETRYDLAAARYETNEVAIDVSCQACHGPGAGHVAWARERDAGAPSPASPAAAGLSGTLASGSASGEIEACAPCHSHRRRASAQAVPGDPFLDHWALSLLREDLYFADGQIDAEVYVTGSFLQSRMHEAGVRCSDCHESHGLGLHAEGNDLCTRCHAEVPDPRFAGLRAGRYDGPEHHFHPRGSAGASCVACHMPARTYMQVDPRHDHSLRIPRPVLSDSVGAPNACSGCHADRDAAWAEAAIEQHRGERDPPPAHWAPELSAARAGEPGSDAALRRLVSESDLPGIVRATALVELPSFPAPENAAAIAAAATDADPIVRHAAAAALGVVPPDQSAAALTRLLRDPRRAVRTEAAHSLAFLPGVSLKDADRAAFGAALDEYRAAQKARPDLPESHLNLGALAARRGRPGAAEAHYRDALVVAPDFLPALANLGGLLNSQGRNEEAEASLRAAVAAATERLSWSPETPGLATDLGQMHFSLGLLLAELGRMDEAAEELGRAGERLPREARVHYNHGLALQRLQRRAPALVALERARAIAPDDPSYEHALAAFHAQDGNRERALMHARRLVVLTGGAPQARELVEQLEAMPGR